MKNSVKIVLLAISAVLDRQRILIKSTILVKTVFIAGTVQSNIRFLKNKKFIVNIFDTTECENVPIMVSNIVVMRRWKRMWTNQQMSRRFLKPFVQKIDKFRCIWPVLTKY